MTKMGFRHDLGPVTKSVFESATGHKFVMKSVMMKNCIAGGTTFSVESSSVSLRNS
jgi:hypothetical protein